MGSIAELLSTNPWADAFAAQLRAMRPAGLAELGAPSRPGPLAALAQARRGFHEALSANGTSAWNAWTQSMLRLRPSFAWRAAEASLMWRALAFVDLSDGRFAGDLDWAAHRFPSDLCISRCRFAGNVYLSAIEVSGALLADGIEFQRDCWFDQVSIGEATSLGGTVCSGRLEARAGRFAGAVDGRQAEFGRDCWFAGSTFAGAADFTGARFRSDAGFGGCVFARGAVFDAVSFADAVGMERCAFDGAASFRSTIFAKRMFLNQARFAQEPVIDRAQFAMAPSLIGTRFPKASGGSAASMLQAVSVRH